MNNEFTLNLADLMVILTALDMAEAYGADAVSSLQGANWMSAAEQLKAQLANVPELIERIGAEVEARKTTV